MPPTQETQPLENPRYPLEYFCAPILFAQKISEITGSSFLDSVGKYTGLKGELTGASFLEEPNDEAWQEFLKEIEGKNNEEIPAIAYSIYLKQPYSKFDPEWTPLFTTRFGSLGVDTHPYNVDPNPGSGRDPQVKTHFLSTRKNGSDLGSKDPVENEVKLEARKQDMKNLLQFVKEKYPQVKFLTTFTWLQNTPNYRALFPADIQMKPKKDSYGGLWGQFIKWDGSANLQTYNAFLTKLKEAKTLDEAIDAIPLKVLGATIPIEKMFEYYLIP